MKNRFITSLAVLALLAGGAAACGDDDPAAVGLTPNNALLALASGDPALAFMAPYMAVASGLVAPGTVTLTEDEMTSGDANEFPATAMAMNMIVSYAGSGGASVKGAAETGTMGIMVFVSGTEVFYIAGSGGSGFNPGGGGSAGLDADDDPAYAVVTENVNDFDGPEDSGVFTNNGDDANEVSDEGTEADMTDGIDVEIPCPTIPGFSSTGDGTSIAFETGTAESVDFEVGLDEVGTAGIEGELILGAEDIDVPLVNVEVSLDCEYTEDD